MYAPIPRPVTFALGLLGSVFTAQLLAASEAEKDEPAPTPTLELPKTRITAQGLGAITEHTGAYTTGSTNTATRLNLSIRDTPQSVSVVTRQEMDDFNLNTLTEAMRHTTGVVVQHNDTDRVSYSSRGYSIQNFQIDGMLNTFSNMKTDADTIIYDRIELVRGATGLTTGAGDPSATINMIRKRPTHELAAKVGVSGGSYDDYYSYVDVGGPLGLDGRLRGRSVLAYRDAKSFRDHYALKREVAYGILEADLTDDTTLSVGYDYFNKEVQGTSWGTLPYWNGAEGKAGLGRATNWVAPWSSWPKQDKTAFATLDQRLFSDWRLKAAYTHRISSTDGSVYYAGGGFPQADGTGMQAYTKHMTGDESMTAMDINISGTYPLFGRDHELMFGYGEATFVNTSPWLIDRNPEGYIQVPDWQNLSNVPKFQDINTGLEQSRDTTQQKAGYLATRFNLSDQWHAVLGTRYGSWKGTNLNKEYDETTYRLTQKNKVTQLHNDMLTPYAGLLYDFTEHLTAYVSYTDIFKPSEEKTINKTYLEPVVGSNYEVGLKGSFLQERLNLSSAVFWSTQDNVPVIDDSVPRGPNGEEYYKSAGKGNKIKGFEIELAGEVMRDWNMMAGYTYTHSRDSEGQRLNSASPLNLFKLSSTYRLPGQWRALTVGAAVNWQSDIFREAWRPTGGKDEKGEPITVADTITQKSYTLVDLMARYEFDKHLSATLNVKNLFDQKYYDNVGFYNGVFWGDPRTVNVGIEWKL
ncbi:TonB-dependent siderophore receptor [Pseudomonas lundensis]|uniref:TonB-dependent siderophore receptor n=1 Tax=Pseudomonas lundensis TaxID=86185 RepID=UPI0014752225|nr:TonB-dependent siderophore receptor [Pseudomonas lundensis]NNA17621.1 TonB-dependent siderophore receptor [Pseudomonas lundensis]